MLFRLRRDFVIRKLNRKKGINIHAALPRFRKFDVYTNQNHSRGNSKVSNFLHSDVSTAFWPFPSYLDHYLRLKGVANGTSKNVGLGKFWQDLEISEAFLISLEVSFLHGLYLLFLSLETFYQRVSGSDF